MATYEKICAAEAAPYMGRSRMQFYIDPNQQVVDLMNTFVQISLVPTWTAAAAGNLAGDVPACYMKGGSASLIRSIDLQTRSGTLLERVDYPNVLTCALQEMVINGRKEASMSVVEGLGRDCKDGYQFLTPYVGAPGPTSAVKACNMRLKLSTILGLFQISEFPIGYTDGLHVSIILENGPNVISQYQVGNPTPFADFADQSTGQTSVLVSAGKVYPAIDYYRRADSDNYKVGDHLIVSSTGVVNGLLGMHYCMVIAVSMNDYGIYSLTVAWTTAAGVAGNGPAAQRDVTVVRAEYQCAISAAPGGGAVHTMLTVVGMTPANSIYYVGEPITVAYVWSGHGALKANATITGIAANGNNLDITFTPGIADADNSGFDAGAIIYGRLMTGGFDFRIDNAYLRLKRTIPTDMVAHASRYSKGFQLPIKSYDSFRESFPATQRINTRIQTPVDLHNALAILSIPVLNSGGAGYDANIRGNRDFYTSYRWTVDNESSPLQPIECVKKWPAVHWNIVGSCLRQLNLLLTKTSPFSWVFPKPLGIQFSSTPIAGKNVNLEILGSQNFDQMTFNHFVLSSKTAICHGGMLVVE